MNATLTALLAGDAPRPIPDLSLPDNLKILVLAPHPDDFDAVGVTLRFLSQRGHSINVGVVRTGSGVEDVSGVGLTPEDMASIREREQRNSLRFFGLPDHCLTFFPLTPTAEGQPVGKLPQPSAVESLVSELAPDIVFLPHGNDTNGSHRAMHELFTQITKHSGEPVAAFLIRDPKTVEMRTDLYMPFGQEEAKWKAELLRFHDSQQQRNLRTRGHGFDQRILDVNKHIARDLSLDTKYAEAFEVELRNT